MKPFDFSFLTQYKMNDLTMILLSFVIGIVIASIAILYRQTFLGNIVRKIIDKKALSESEALTLEQLGINPNNILVKFALRDNSTFRKIVIKTEQNRYYIPEERRIREEIRFRKKGNDVVAVIIGAILFVLAAFILLTVIPWLTDHAKDIFNTKQ